MTSEKCFQNISFTDVNWETVCLEDALNWWHEFSDEVKRVIANFKTTVADLEEEAARIEAWELKES